MQLLVRRRSSHAALLVWPSMASDACGRVPYLRVLHDRVCLRYDGGAMNYASGCGPVFCSDTRRHACAWPPSMLDVMMQMYDARGASSAYNEVR